MSMKPVQKELLSVVGERLLDHGFQKRPVGQAFVEVKDFGKIAIHLAFIDHEFDLDVTVDVAVRFDAVEELVQSSNALLSKTEKAQTFTLGAELGNLERGEPWRWTLASRSDVAGTAERIMEKIVAIGLPYLDKYSHLGAAFDALSGDDRAAWLHSPIHAERAKRATAMLVVMGKSDDLEAFTADKVSFLSSIDDPGLPDYKRFVSSAR